MEIFPTARILKNVRVPMRDGVLLAVDIYLPETEGTYPALLAMSAYGKNTQRQLLPQPFPSPIGDACIEAGWTDDIVGRGFAHVIACTRGSGQSEGEYLSMYSEQESKDGYDLVEWIADQPWCDGSVGMIGINYFGTIQLVVAFSRPPHLKAIAPTEATTDQYLACYHGGVLDGFYTELGIHVDAHDVRTFEAEPREPHQHVDQALDVHRRLASEGADQEVAGPQALDHAARLGAREGRAREDHVTDGLGEDAAEPERDAGPELGIAHQARDELASALDLLGHEQSLEAVFGSCSSEKVLGGAAYGFTVAETEADQVALGLVRDALAAELHHHGEADLGGGSGRGLGALHEPFFAEPQAVPGEQLLRVVLREQPRALFLRHGGKIARPPAQLLCSRRPTPM